MTFKSLQSSLPWGQAGDEEGGVEGDEHGFDLDLFQTFPGSPMGRPAVVAGRLGGQSGSEPEFRGQIGKLPGDSCRN